MIMDLLKHSFTLQMEILAMVSEEIHQRAENYVQSHSDEAYEAFLSQLIDNVEKTLDTFAGPLEGLMEQFQSLRPASGKAPGFFNWNEAFETLNARIQELKNNQQA